jgi:hypothetical protein
MGAEVNLVAAALPPSPSPQGLTYMVRTVLPHVALDVVSYSSYDTMAGPQFADALDYIAAQHVPTSATPLNDSAVYVAEFGVAQMRNPLATVEAVTQNVVKVALSAGPGGKRRAAHVFWWELCVLEQPPRASVRAQVSAMSNPSRARGWPSFHLRSFFLTSATPFHATTDPNPPFADSVTRTTAATASQGVATGSSKQTPTACRAGGL